jgi:hypothetical protein
MWLYIYYIVFSWYEKYYLPVAITVFFPKLKSNEKLFKSKSAISMSEIMQKVSIKSCYENLADKWYYLLAFNSLVFFPDVQ